MSDPVGVLRDLLTDISVPTESAVWDALADVEALVQAAQRVAASSAYPGIGEAPWTVDPAAAVELHTALRPFSSEESDSDKETAA